MAKISEIFKNLFTRRIVVLLIIIFLLGFIWGWLGAIIKMQRLLGQ